MQRLFLRVLPAVSLVELNPTQTHILFQVVRAEQCRPPRPPRGLFLGSLVGRVEISPIVFHYNSRPRDIVFNNASFMCLLFPPILLPLFLKSNNGATGIKKIKKNNNLKALLFNYPQWLWICCVCVVTEEGDRRAGLFSFFNLQKPHCHTHTP